MEEKDLPEIVVETDENEENKTNEEQDNMEEINPVEQQKTTSEKIIDGLSETGDKVKDEITKKTKVIGTLYLSFFRNPIKMAKEIKQDGKVLVSCLLILVQMLICGLAAWTGLWRILNAMSLGSFGSKIPATIFFNPFVSIAVYSVVFILILTTLSKGKLTIKESLNIVAVASIPATAGTVFMWLAFLIFGTYLVTSTLVLSITIAVIVGLLSISVNLLNTLISDEYEDSSIAFRTTILTYMIAIFAAVFIFLSI